MGKFCTSRSQTRGVQHADKEEAYDEAEKPRAVNATTRARSPKSVCIDVENSIRVKRDNC